MSEEVPKRVWVGFLPKREWGASEGNRIVGVAVADDGQQPMHHRHRYVKDSPLSPETVADLAEWASDLERGARIVRMYGGPGLRPQALATLIRKALSELGVAQEAVEGGEGEC